MLFCNERVFVSLNSNNHSMKKKIIYAAILILFVLAAPACSKTCKTCKKVYYTNQTTYDHEDSAAQYCGTELIGIEAQGAVTIGSYTVKWQCN